MSALRLVCNCMEWWGDWWKDPNPFVIGPTIETQTDWLPIAPVTIYVMTHDAMEAAQLLRLAADRLEREPALLLPVELAREPRDPTPGDDTPF